MRSTQTLYWFVLGLARHLVRRSRRHTSGPCLGKSATASRKPRRNIMTRRASLVVVLVMFISGDAALAEKYYRVTLAAVPTGPVPTEAVSFRFQSANFILPPNNPYGSSLNIENEPGFALNGTPREGFSLECVCFGWTTDNGGRPVNPEFLLYLTNSSTGEVLYLNAFDLMSSAPNSDGTYVLKTVSYLFPGNPLTTVPLIGDYGFGSLSVTPYFLPIGYDYCPAVTDGRQLNSTLGRIYDPFTESCVDGAVGPLVPPPGDSICTAGVNGLGGFYIPSSSYCDFGAIVPLLFDLCPAGSYSWGGFYQSAKGEGCDHGVVLPAGDAYCHRGPKGPGGLYIEATEYCDRGKVGSYFPHP